MAASKRSKRGSSPRARARTAPAPPWAEEVGRLERLLELMKEHGLAELELGADGRSLRASKAASGAAAAPHAVPRSSLSAPPSAESGAPQIPAAAAAGPAPSADAPASGEPFLSPMVGTFYRAASPETKPFVIEGDKVRPETTLCIIEAMKVMNEIRAERAGRVVQILVENGEAVEYGQPLFILQSD